MNEIELEPELEFSGYPVPKNVAKTKETKARDASQPVNLSSVYLRWSVEWFWAVVYRALVGPQEELRGPSGYSPRWFTSSPRREAKYFKDFSGFMTKNKQTNKQEKVNYSNMFSNAKVGWVSFVNFFPSFSLDFGPF